MAGSVNAGGYNQELVNTPFIPVLCSMAATKVILNYEQCGLLPQISNQNWSGDIMCAEGVPFMREPEVALASCSQNNEDPMLLNPQFDFGLMRVCQHEKFEIKISEHDVRRMCSNFAIWEEMVKRAINRAIFFGPNGMESYVLQKALAMAAPENTGNQAGPVSMSVQLGDNAAPVAWSAGGETNCKAVRKTLRNIAQVAFENNWQCNGVDAVLIMDPATYSLISECFEGLNLCCSDKNPMVSGMIETPIYGFKAFVTNHMPVITVGGVVQHYILALDYARMWFAQDVYNYKWWEDKFERYLVGEWRYDAYLSHPNAAIVATITL